MKSVTLASMAMSLGLANAQVRFCDANRRPNWEDCKTVVEDFAMEGNPEIAHINGELDPAPSCMHYWHNDGNCLITHCFQEEPTENPDGPREITLGQIHQLYDPIRSRCSTLRAGGEFTGAFEFVNVFNDEDRGGGGGAEAVKRGLFAEGGRTSEGLIKGHSTLDQYLEWRNDTASDNERIASDVLQKRNNPEPVKRQNDDDYFQIEFEALGIRHPTDYERGPRLGSGVGYEWEVTESQTYSVTTSVSMGASWNIFTASIGVEATESETFTVREGITFDVDCPNQAQITFYPLYDYYEIISHPSETRNEIWIPVLTSNRKVNGEVATSCLG
ncbi:hypothetical protein CC79DRAFT_1391877 [Sarocladium strictum]